MNKILQIMTIIFLCIANHVSASKEDGAIDSQEKKTFQEKKIFFQEFQSKKEVKKSKITPVKMNVGDEHTQKKILLEKFQGVECLDGIGEEKFSKCFKMKPVSSNIILFLDPKSIGRFLCVSKDINSIISNILKIGFTKRLFHIDLENHKDLLQSCAKKALEENVEGNRDFYLSSLFFLRNLDTACKENAKFKISLDNFQKINCMELPKWVSISIDSIWENTLNPIFSSFLVIEKEKEMGWQKLLEESCALDKYSNLSYNSCFSLFLDFAFNKGLTLKDEFFLDSCFKFHIETYFPVKFFLKKGFDVKKDINFIKILEYCCDVYQQRGDYLNSSRMQQAILFINKNRKKK